MTLGITMEGARDLTVCDSQYTVVDILSALVPFTRGLETFGAADDYPLHVGNDWGASAYDISREEVAAALGILRQLGYLVQHLDRGDGAAAEWPAKSAPLQKALTDRLVQLEIAARQMLPYLRFTIGPESPGHHPTMPSAVAAFEAAIEGTHRRLEEMSYEEMRSLTQRQLYDLAQPYLPAQGSENEALLLRMQANFSVNVVYGKMLGQPEDPYSPKELRKSIVLYAAHRRLREIATESRRTDPSDHRHYRHTTENRP